LRIGSWTIFVEIKYILIFKLAIKIKADKYFTFENQV